LLKKTHAACMDHGGRRNPHNIVGSSPASLSVATRGAPRAATRRSVPAASGGRRCRRQLSGRQRRPVAEPKLTPPASPPPLLLSSPPPSSSRTSTSPFLAVAGHRGRIRPPPRRIRACLLRRLGGGGAAAAAGLGGRRRHRWGRIRPPPRRIRASLGRSRALRRRRLGGRRRFGWSRCAPPPLGSWPRRRRLGLPGTLGLVVAAALGGWGLPSRAASRCCLGWSGAPGHAAAGGCSWPCPWLRHSPGCAIVRPVRVLSSGLVAGRWPTAGGGGLLLPSTLGWVWGEGESLGPLAG